MKLAANLLKISLLLTLFPASASAVTITISALNDEATIANVTASGSVTTKTGGYTTWYWYFFGDYLENYPVDPSHFTLTGSVTGDGKNLTSVYFSDNGSSDIFGLRFDDGFMYASFNVSGSGTINLAQHGLNFASQIQVRIT